MTVAELKEKLDQFDDETPVKLALQPSYPMFGHIQNVCTLADSSKSATGEVCVIASSENEDYGCPREVWTDSYVEGESND